MATNENTFVWSDGTAVGSDAEKTFTVHAANGIRLLGGPITGDGSGLTGTGTTFTAGNALALGGVALGGLVQTSRVVSVVINGATNSATLNADAVIDLGTITGGGSGVIPIALLPGSALTFGSTNNATIIGTSNADVGSTSNNWDELEFDWLTVQGATWQVMNPNATGLTNVQVWIRSPATGNLTNVFSFGYAAGTNGGLRPPTWTPSITWTQAVATVTNELQVLTGTITCPAVGPVWFSLRRDATSAADTLATNSYFVGGRLW
jgi:hypothetical protein